MRWTEKEIEYLKDNYSTNKDLNKICKNLKRSRRAILHKGVRLGLSRSKHLSRKYPEKTPRKVIEKRYYEKNKNRIYQRRVNRLEKRREKFKKLLGGKCSKCGYNKSLYALDFHHNEGFKEGNVSRIIKDSSEQKALKEIEKCILLCANCHRELHHKG